LLVPRQGHLDNDVTEHLAENGQLSLAPEVVLRKIFVKARKGDTLSVLAARHGVTASNMANWNNLRENAKLNTGQNLAMFVPSQASRRVAKPCQNSIKAVMLASVTARKIRPGSGSWTSGQKRW
jgi:membrane-bound lytic murein transglycosylase D